MESEEDKVFKSMGIEGHEEHLAEIKAAASELLASINAVNFQYPEANRLAEFAKMNLEQSVMWAVKALSRNQP